MTWERLIELEPRLLALYNRALANRRSSGRRFDAEDVLIGSGMWDELNDLVGSSSRKDNPELGTSEAHFIAFNKLFYEALQGELSCNSQP